MAQRSCTDFADNLKARTTLADMLLLTSPQADESHDERQHSGRAHGIPAVNPVNYQLPAPCTRVIQWTRLQSSEKKMGKMPVCARSDI